ncbi:unnamed protein product [Trifolium pratense]|uniref:Uncharacterized protein n=1 Tax=Trifolium pratense TaxID=57577 RepID=A0ACB0IJM5_TRIPR|nr:unnamed protein product [Trifolium pratense]
MARSSSVHAGSLLPSPECTTNFVSNQNYNMSQYYNQQRQQALFSNLSSLGFTSKNAAVTLLISAQFRPFQRSFQF